MKIFNSLENKKKKYNLMREQLSSIGNINIFDSKKRDEYNLKIVECIVLINELSLKIENMNYDNLIKTKRLIQNEIRSFNICLNEKSRNCYKELAKINKKISNLITIKLREDFLVSFKRLEVLNSSINNNMSTEFLEFCLINLKEEQEKYNFKVANQLDKNKYLDFKLKVTIVINKINKILFKNEKKLLKK